MPRSKTPRRAPLSLLAAALVLAGGEAAARWALARFPPRAARCPWSDACWRMQAAGNLARRPAEGLLPAPLVYDAALGWRNSPELARPRSRGRRVVLLGDETLDETLRLTLARASRLPADVVAARGWGQDQMLTALDRELSAAPATTVVLVWSGDQGARAGLSWREYARPSGGPAPAPPEAARRLGRSRLLLLARAGWAWLSGPAPSYAGLDAGLSALRARAEKSGADFRVYFVGTPEEALGRAACARLGLDCESVRKSIERDARSAPSPSRRKGAGAILPT